MDQHSRRQWNRIVVSGTCDACARSGMIRHRFSGDQRRHSIHLWFQLTWIGKEAIRRSRSWHDYRYHVIFAETHLSIEPRRALAIIRSAVRKRFAFPVRSPYVLWPSISSPGITVSPFLSFRLFVPPWATTGYLTYCSRYIFRRALSNVFYDERA